MEKKPNENLQEIISPKLTASSELTFFITLSMSTISLSTFSIEARICSIERVEEGDLGEE